MFPWEEGLCRHTFESAHITSWSSDDEVEWWKRWCAWRHEEQDPMKITVCVPSLILHGVGNWEIRYTWHFSSNPRILWWFIISWSTDQLRKIQKTHWSHTPILQWFTISWFQLRCNWEIIEEVLPETREGVRQLDGRFKSLGEVYTVGVWEWIQVTERCTQWIQTCWFLVTSIWCGDSLRNVVVPLVVSSCSPARMVS